MKNREKIYFFITLVLMFVGTILQAILLNFCYEADKRLYITGTLPVVYYVLSFVTTVFALSGLIVLKKKDGKTERLPEKNGAVLFFGVLAGLFFAAVFALSTLEGVVTMGTKLADRSVCMFSAVRYLFYLCVACSTAKRECRGTAWNYGDGVVRFLCCQCVF